MKFFWKLFFSIILVTEFFVGISGYVLIYSSFKNAIEREIETAYQENDMLYFSLNQRITWSVEMSNITLMWGIPEEGTENYEEILTEAMSIQTTDSAITVSFSDAEGQVICGSRKKGFDAELVKKLGNQERGYEIRKIDDDYLIHCARYVKLLNQEYFIENYRDITEVFDNQAGYIQTFSMIMGLLFLVGGVVIFIISYWLVRPIHLLSQATRRLAEGDDMKLVQVNSRDEIGQLAEDFNRMAGRLSENMEALKDYARRQEMFVGNFDHELKTPLTSIIGYADMLRSKRMTEEQTVLLANQIVQEGKRLQVMSEKLMQLTVLKRRDFKLRRVSAKYFLTSVYDTVFPAMQADGIRFIGEIQDGKLNIEPDLMKTVCINLLDNARKAIDGKNGQVILSGKSIKGGYEISVSDNGCGIPEGELSKITEAFYMVDKARSRGRGGAGLGLAVCMAIMEVHQGKISFESVQDMGTCVRVVLVEVNRDDTDQR